MKFLNKPTTVISCCRRVSIIEELLVVDELELGQILINRMSWMNWINWMNG